MQTGPVTLILALCLMGGLIAYLADLLGRMLGKKRLTLGHMRPKHTAALLTTLAGVFIPILTISLISLLFSDVREMLFRTQAIKNELAAVEQQLNSSRNELDKRIGEVAILETQTTSLKKEGDQLKKTKAQTEKQLDSTQRRLRTTERSLLSRTTQIRLLTTRTGVLGKEVRSLAARVKASANELQDLERQVQESKVQTAAAAAELRSIQTRNVDLERQNLNLEQARVNLQAEIKEIQKQFDQSEIDARRSIEQAQKELSNLQQAQTNLTNQINDLERQARGLVEMNSALSRTVDAARTQPMIFYRDAELARWFVNAGASREAASNAIQSLLRISRSRAEARGARAVPGLVAAADIFADPANSRESQIDGVIRAVTSQPDEVVVLSLSLRNSFIGEPVAVRLQVEPNSVVYREAQMIAEARIDGSRTEREILDAIGVFIRTKVAPKALQDGMIPVEGSEAPLGEVDDEQIVSLMQTLRDFRQTVRVQAVAAGLTRRGDRLQLEFRFR